MSITRSISATEPAFTQDGKMQFL